MKIGAIVAKEARELVPPTLLFLFLFHMVALTKAVSLGDYSSSALRATTATIGALLVGKAILLVEALPISRRFTNRRIVHIIWKTSLFAGVTLLFRFLEEIIELASKRGGLRAAIAVMDHEISWPLFWVLSLWIVSALLLYSLGSEMVRAVGADETKKILLGPGA